MNQGLFTSKTGEWETPQALYDWLNKQYHFNLDPCATGANAKCLHFFCKATDGLSQSWAGKRVFCNPPYGRQIGKWIVKAASCGAEVVVCLLPARTDTKWWHGEILAKADAIFFIKGRLHFGDGKQAAPFPSAIVVFRRGIGKNGLPHVGAVTPKMWEG